MSEPLNMVITGTANASGQARATSDLFQQVKLGALRWLHGIDLDPASCTYGIADRDYWAWKTKDFANGTCQGGLAGFLDAAPLLDFTSSQIQRVVSAVIQGTATIQRRNGSFEEAYPLESSYCVTALVIFNLVYACQLYPDAVDTPARAQLRQIVERGLRFLERTPETHGVIANHLATGVLAVQMARQFLGLPMQSKPVEDFLGLQHPAEGWFPEYGGADPGYQTLLNHYLTAAWRVLKDDRLRAPLAQSVAFTQGFCFPNGSYAAEVGHRGTAIVYPSGTLEIRDTGKTGAGNFEKTPMSNWFTQAYQASTHAVNPTNADAGNFVPVFNAWALFATLQSEFSPENNVEWQYSAQPDQHFPQAGLWVFRRGNAMMAFSENSSALRRVVQTQPGTWEDDSIVALTQKNLTQGVLTTQGIAPANLQMDAGELKWQYRAIQRNQPLNTLVSAIALRLMSICCYVFPQSQRVLKQMLSAFVMRKGALPQTIPVEARVQLTDESLPVSISQPEGALWQIQRAGFHQHMASANTFDERGL